MVPLESGLDKLHCITFQQMKGLLEKPHLYLCVYVQILDASKRVLLWCATPDALLRLRSTRLAEEEDYLNRIYDKEQKHGSLMSYLNLKIRTKHSAGLFAQVCSGA